MASTEDFHLSVYGNAVEENLNLDRSSAYIVTVGVRFKSSQLPPNEYFCRENFFFINKNYFSNYFFLIR